MKKILSLFLPLTLATAVITSLLLVGCGGGEATTATTAPPTSSTSTTSMATSISETSTTAEQILDEELVGVWTSEQGIELEFTSDGVVFLRYQGQQAESPYSTKEGKISYVDFEPNERGERVLEYTLDCDKLVWDVGGGGELAFTRKQ